MDFKLEVLSKMKEVEASKAKRFPDGNHQRVSPAAIKEHLSTISDTALESAVQSSGIDTLLEVVSVAK